MKNLTKREAMEILLAGGKVDYYYTDGSKGIHSPFHWDEKKGLVDRGGNVPKLNWQILKEHREPRTVTHKRWFNVFVNGVSCPYSTKELALEADSCAADGYINTIEIEITATEEVEE